MLASSHLLSKSFHRSLLSTGIKRNEFLRKRFSPELIIMRSSKSWVPTEDALLQKVTTQALIHEISLQQFSQVQEVVPWFLKTMPASYFRQVSEDMRKSHLKAIVAILDLKQSDLSLKIETIVNPDLKEITLIKTTPKTGLLLEQLKTLPIQKNSSLSRIRVFSSASNEIALNIFSFEKNNHTPENKVTKQDASHIYNFVEEIKNGLHKGDPSVPKYSDAMSPEALEEYLSRCSLAYVKSSNPKRFFLQKELFEKVKFSDNIAVSIDTYGGSGGPAGTTSAWITIAAGNVLPEELLKTTSVLLSAQHIDIFRAHLDVVKVPENSTVDIPAQVTMLRLLISPDPSKSSEINVDSLTNMIRRSIWLDDDVIDLGLSQLPSLGLEKAEIITALSAMLHGPLSKLNSYAFASVKSIIQLLGSSPHFLNKTSEIAQLFMDKFRPNGLAISNETFFERERELSSRISKLQNADARTVLNKLLQATEATLRTNFYKPDRYALSLRVHPSIMSIQPSSASNPSPFGVFFIHGRYFNAFHCRFRDIARGGLRIVTPPNTDQFALESARHFDEAYGLSLAQQLKNKDIPEGGAKAVILVNNPVIPAAARFYSVRKCIRGFTDSLLDLITKESVSGLVDHYNREELVYLGPDEQVIPSDIDWIVDRAAIRGYPIPAAFMSSKRNAGFNHKEFGVTSEGVVVYLDVALRHSLNINPKEQPFTVKITGGPDGDVAGNLMKILFRDYPTTVKIVGVADGFGVAEDPEGLDRIELLRLVEKSLAITQFDPSKLSKQGVVLNIVTQEGLLRRNSMHFKVKADAFIPAGGRPHTINNENWREFLDEHGRPSSPLIVEGANIFLTPQARDALFTHAGVAIVKDSSANKCGVITSSCEVAASMLITTEQFMAIKPQLVTDVLKRLRLLARLEAELLFREYKNYPGALPYFSERISNAINRVTDAVTDALAAINPEDELFQELMPLIKENLPEKLAEIAWDLVPQKFPVQYQRNAIASTLASKLVYLEGIHLVEAQPDDRLAQRAFLYYREDQKIQKLLQNLHGAELPLELATKQQVMDLLRKGGARTSLEIF